MGSHSASFGYRTIGAVHSLNDANPEDLIMALAAKFGLNLVQESTARRKRKGQFAKELLARRRKRDRAFEIGLFADPAWDMLLDLFVAYQEGRPAVSVSSLCIAAAVPSTTALRWIKSMIDQGLLKRESDPNDGRRVFIHLTDTAIAKMDRLIGEWSDEE